jgi:hypothetical protein
MTPYLKKRRLNIFYYSTVTTIHDLKIAQRETLCNPKSSPIAAKPNGLPHTFPADKSASKGKNAFSNY